MSPSTKRALSLAARVGLIVGAIAFVLRGVNGPVVLATLRLARPGPLVAVVVLNAVAMGLKAARLRWLLRGAATLRASWLAKLTASAMNNVMPLRGGDMARLWMLERHAGISKTGAFAIAFVEGLFDIATLAALALAAAASAASQRWATGAALVLGLAATALIALSRRIAQPYGMTPGGSSRLARLVGATVARLEPGVRALRDRGVIARALLVSALAWGIELGMIVLCGRAAHLPISPPLAAMILLAINVALAVPSSPAGAGAFESAVVVVLTLAGVGKSPALAFALLYHLIQAVPVTLVGALVVWRAGITLDRLPADRAAKRADAQPVTSAMARPSQPLTPTV